MARCRSSSFHVGEFIGIAYEYKRKQEDDEEKRHDNAITDREWCAHIEKALNKKMLPGWGVAAHTFFRGDLLSAVPESLAHWYTVHRSMMLNGLTEADVHECETCKANPANPLCTRCTGACQKAGHFWEGRKPQGWDGLK